MFLRSLRHDSMLRTKLSSFTLMNCIWIKISKTIWGHQTKQVSNVPPWCTSSDHMLFLPSVMFHPSIWYCCQFSTETTLGLSIFLLLASDYSGSTVYRGYSYVRFIITIIPQASVAAAAATNETNDRCSFSIIIAFSAELHSVQNTLCLSIPSRSRSLVRSVHSLSRSLVVSRSLSSHIY